MCMYGRSHFASNTDLHRRPHLSTQRTCRALCFQLFSTLRSSFVIKGLSSLAKLLPTYALPLDCLLGCCCYTLGDLGNHGVRNTVCVFTDARTRFLPLFLVFFERSHSSYSKTWSWYDTIKWKENNQGRPLWRLFVQLILFPRLLFKKSITINDVFKINYN